MNWLEKARDVLNVVLQKPEEDPAYELTQDLQREVNELNDRMVRWEKLVANAQERNAALEKTVRHWEQHAQSTASRNRELEQKVDALTRPAAVKGVPTELQSDIARRVAEAYATYAGRFDTVASQVNSTLRAMAQLAGRVDHVEKRCDGFAEGYAELKIKVTQS